MPDFVLGLGDKGGTKAEWKCCAYPLLRETSVGGGWADRKKAKGEKLGQL